LPLQVTQSLSFLFVWHASERHFVPKSLTKPFPIIRGGGAEGRALYLDREAKCHIEDGFYVGKSP
jgi:hypothetical protein